MTTDEIKRSASALAFGDVGVSSALTQAALFSIREGVGKESFVDSAEEAYDYVKTTLVDSAKAYYDTISKQEAMKTQEPVKDHKEEILDRCEAGIEMCDKCKDESDAENS